MSKRSLLALKAKHGAGQFALPYAKAYFYAKVKGFAGERENESPKP